jgi:hypothetical protein
MTTGIQHTGPSSPGKRGQTLYDYALGISLFVLTITATVSLLPSLIPTGQDGPSGAVSAATDRVAQDVLTNGTTATARDGNTLDPRGVQQVGNLSDEQLQRWFALRTTWQVNVTVTTLDGGSFVADGDGSPLTAGATYRDQAGGEAVRIVTLSNDSYADCTPACRLVVRVW